MHPRNQVNLVHSWSVWCGAMQERPEFREKKPQLSAVQRIRSLVDCRGIGIERIWFQRSPRTEDNVLGRFHWWLEMKEQTRVPLPIRDQRELIEPIFSLRMQPGMIHGSNQNLVLLLFPIAWKMKGLAISQTKRMNRHAHEDNLEHFAVHRQFFLKYLEWIHFIHRLSALEEMAQICFRRLALLMERSGLMSRPPFDLGLQILSQATE